MNESVKVDLLQVVGSPFWVAEEDGDMVFEQIKSALEGGCSVVLSFAGVEALTTSFLNQAIGRLYGVFSVELLQSKLSAVHVPESQVRRLKEVIEAAKLFYNDPAAFEAARTEAIGDYV